MGAFRRSTTRLAGVLISALLAGCAITDPSTTPSPAHPPTATATSPTEAPKPTPTEAPKPTPTETPEPPEPTVTAIVGDLTDARIGVYGVRTKATFAVKAVGRKLTYVWQQRSEKSGKWKAIKGAKSAKYTARARDWGNGTQFRVIVTGKQGRVTSKVATLTVVKPTNTPAKDAERAFGLSGLRQGLDLSAYQYAPDNRVRLSAVKAWTGKDGFTILRTGSGDRPINYEYTDVCTGKRGKTKRTPATRDCAYRALARGATKAGLSLGHYWFNGWLASIDTTDGRLFSGDNTPTRSAKLFVSWLKADGNYTRHSTDPLVLDIEQGTTRKLTTDDGTTYRHELRHWTPDEALEFLTAVRQQLTSDGYHANLYVYMSANTTVETDGWYYAWADVARIARLWVASWGTDNGRIPDSEPFVGPWIGRGGWSIWQYTSQARLRGDGVDAVDANIAKADAWTPR